MNTRAPKEPAPVVVVRLRTSIWKDDRGGLQIKRSITPLARKCTGHNFFTEEIDMVGADLVYAMLKNLENCEDGIYRVLHCNVSQDWETGTVDSYDFELMKEPA